MLQVAEAMLQVAEAMLQVAEAATSSRGYVQVAEAMYK